jgi:hypothetical protein
MLPRIRELFHRMDADGSGEITLDELGDVDDEVKEELLYVVKADEILDLFNMLDCDGGGTLDIDEFCTGITRMATSGQSVEMMTMLKLLKMLRADISDMQTDLKLVSSNVRQNTEDIADIKEKLGLKPRSPAAVQNGSKEAPGPY